MLGISSYALVHLTIFALLIIMPVDAVDAGDCFHLYVQYRFLPFFHEYSCASGSGVTCTLTPTGKVMTVICCRDCSEFYPIRKNMADALSAIQSLLSQVSSLGFGGEVRTGRRRHSIKRKHKWGEGHWQFKHKSICKNFPITTPIVTVMPLLPVGPSGSTHSCPWPHECHQDSPGLFSCTAHRQIRLTGKQHPTCSRERTGRRE